MPGPPFRYHSAYFHKVSTLTRGLIEARLEGRAWRSGLLAWTGRSDRSTGTSTVQARGRRARRWKRSDAGMPGPPPQYGSAYFHDVSTLTRGLIEAQPERRGWRSGLLAWTGRSDRSTGTSTVQARGRRARGWKGSDAGMPGPPLQYHSAYFHEVSTLTRDPIEARPNTCPWRCAPSLSGHLRAAPLKRWKCGAGSVDAGVFPRGPFEGGTGRTGPPP
jgi:hypothetical protein